MKQSRIIAIILLSAWVILAYQNCSSGQEQAVPATNPNSTADDFLLKIKQDAENLITIPNCLPVFVDCDGLAANSEEQISCLQENASRFYQSLNCQGFSIEEKGNCYFAINSTEVNALDPIHIEGTCFYDNQNPDKTLHLDVCTIEYVGFDPENPSTDTDISAWLNIGNQQPYSRFTKTISYYPNQGSAEIRLANVTSTAPLFSDACGKTRNVEWLDTIFTITIN
jgi:hypothetical protein